MEKFRIERCECHKFAKIQCICITVYVSDRPCLAFVISNMLRIGSQSILRLIAQFNPPRSRQRPFLEYLYAINNFSTGILIANYVNGLDRAVSSTGVCLQRTWYFPYKLGFIIKCNLLCLFGDRNCRNILIKIHAQHVIQGNYRRVNNRVTAENRCDHRNVCTIP